MKILLDTHALIEYLSGSKKAEKVKTLILASSSVATTVLNLYELRYKLAKKSSNEAADRGIETLKTGTSVFTIEEENAILASDLKMRYPKLGAVDCHTLAVAQMKGYVMVTGDPDFPKSEKIIQI